MSQNQILGRLFTAFFALAFLLSVPHLEAQQVINTTGSTAIDGTGSSDGVDFSGNAAGMGLDVTDGVNVNTNNHAVGINTAAITAGGSAAVVFAGSSNVFGSVGTVGTPLTSINAGVNGKTVAFGGDVFTSVLNFGGNGVVTFANNANLTGSAFNTSGVNNQGQLSFLGATTVSGNLGTSGATGSLREVDFGGNTAMSGNVFAQTIDAGATGTTVAFAGNANTSALNFTGNGRVTFANNANLIGSAFNTSGVNNQGQLSFLGATTVGGNLGTSGATGSLREVDFSGNTAMNGNVFAQTINAGVTGTTVAFAGNATTSALNFTGDGRVTFANGANLIGSAFNTSGVNNQGQLSFLGATTVSGNLGAAGATGSLREVDFGGNTAMNADIFAQNTLLNAGTLSFGGVDRTFTGNLSAASGTTVDVGTNTINVSGNYNQAAGSALDVTTNYYNASTGKITVGGSATVSSGSAVHVTVGGYIPHQAVVSLITSTGAAVSTPSTLTDTSAFVDFNLSSNTSTLFMTADRTLTGFSSSAVTDNEKSVGWALDNVTNGTADMVTQLNTLETLSRPQINASLDTLLPETDGGLQRMAFSSLSNFSGLAVNRLANLRAEQSSQGIRDDSLWIQGYGSFLDQGATGSSNGYKATIWGTALGFDRPLFSNRDLRLGASFGYANGRLRSKDNSNPADSDSYQLALYGSYNKDNSYLTGTLLYGWGDYASSRNPTVGGVARLAQARFNGSQYGTYWELGHAFEKNGWQLTPLASLEYQHFGVDASSESGAGDLGLNLNRQSYERLQSGVGAKLSRTFEGPLGLWQPELHAKWLHDFSNDGQLVTASFIGGGPSFQVSGPRPSADTGDVGLGVTLFTKSHVEIAVSYGLLANGDFTEQTGLLNLRYKF